MKYGHGVNTGWMVKLQKILRQTFKKCQMGVTLDKVFLQMLTFQFLIIYLEITFHLLIFDSMDGNSIFPVLIALPAGTLLTFITGLFGKRVNKILTWMLISGLCILYCIQLIYHSVFKAFLSLYSVGAVGSDILQFSNQIVLAVFHNILEIMALLLPLPVLGVLMKRILNFERKHFLWQSALLTVCVSLHIIILMLLPVYGKNVYSPYDLYHNSWVQEFGIRQLGVLTGVKFDLEHLFFKRNNNSLESILILQAVPAKADMTVPMAAQNASDTFQGATGEDLNAVQITIPTIPQIAAPQTQISPTVLIPTVTPVPVQLPIDTLPNILDLDFEELAKQDKNNNRKAMHRYFAAAIPTNKNKYTGMFKGYNLIMLTAEGFSPYAVDKDITPTLYKLVHEGFVFNRFYTPLWWASTIDGEYAACTGLIPEQGVISFNEASDNFMPFSLGNQLGKLGYGTRAYHNHTYTYYKRQLSHPNMGYIYKGVGNGLKVTDTWPESDLEMMEVTIPEYINDQPFHTYYMTVSGHMNYTFLGNSMSSKNKKAVEALPYSMEAKAYIACNIELDRALEKLVSELTKAGIADRTVIALSADHYPYGLEKDKIDELAGLEVEENFELYRNHFILWSAGIKEPIVIDKVCSSLDIIPTLSNLFALPYDSRLFMGQDILSDSSPLVIFSNRSFINDKIQYNSETMEVTKLTTEELPTDYLQTMTEIVNRKFALSQSILDEDYYRYIFPGED